MMMGQKITQEKYIDIEYELLHINYFLISSNINFARIFPIKVKDSI